MNLNQFMSDGIADIMRTAGRYSVRSAKGRAFLARMAPQVLKSAAIRDRQERKGHHIPPFLIASVASQCNLHCAGCYARAGGCLAGPQAADDLTREEWSRLFFEAADLGVSFTLLAGGEPLMRREVIEAAAQCKSMIFPIFTNGTLVDETYMELFDVNRHLIPVLSIEGDEQKTDARRGAGVSANIRSAMEGLIKRRIPFGASLTATRTNLDQLLDEAFVGELRDRGCGILFYVEYVPTEAGTEDLALGDGELKRLARGTDRLKSQFPDLVILSFPGDEAAMGGCLASGRGFFHINPTGGAEPCPFSPYSKHNLRESTILEVLDSGYFDALRALSASAGPHVGGCVLFQREREVRALCCD